MRVNLQLQYIEKTSELYRIEDVNSTHKFNKSVGRQSTTKPTLLTFSSENIFQITYQFLRILSKYLICFV